MTEGELALPPNPLLLWAVYASLDTATNSRAVHDRRLPEEWMADWRARDLDDEQLLAAIAFVYANNNRRQNRDEPRLIIMPAIETKLESKKKRARALQGPALWVSWHDNAPDLVRPESPDLVGTELVPIVRRLMTMDSPPPIPDGPRGDPRRWEPQGLQA